ncbi:MAG: YqaE/Pmp3 family membrane protein, partial [Bacteroidota bacterium]
KSDTKISVKDKIKAAKTINKLKKAAKRGDADGIPTVVLFILAVLLPPIAVGLVTDWDLEQTLINVGLTFLCWLPGIVHAIIVVSRARP